MDTAPQLRDLLLLFGAAIAVCMVLTRVVRAAAQMWGLVDRPDGRRKIHPSPIPVAGGVAIYLSASVSLAVAAAVLPSWSDALEARRATLLSLFAAASVIAVVGVWDDIRGLRGRYKLVGQILAAAIVVWGGDIRVESFTVFDQTFSLGNYAIPVTLFWLLGAINSLNLIDGIDGLLGTVGLILCLTIGGMAFVNGNFAAACVAMTLAGAILAFLGYNFPPASIYLGDAGSMLIGLVVGSLAIMASLKGPATVALAAPLALMVIPIFDTSAAIIRRKLTGRSIYTTDRGHLHHVLMWNGLSNRRVLLTVGVLCAVAGAGALVTSWQKNELYAVSAAVAVVFSLVAFRLFGRAELLLVKERLLAVVSSIRHRHEPGRIHQSQVHLQGTGDWNTLWRDLTLAAEELRLRSMTLDVNAPAIHEGFHARWQRVHREDDEMPGVWRVQVPLSAHGHVVGQLDLVGQQDEDSAWQKLNALAKIVEDVESAIAEIAVQKGIAPAAPTPFPLRPAEVVRL
jgi:UDP-GlcNAc:undecaprenyl-phosphate GlcNAc-1-phosphate transferase